MTEIQCNAVAEPSPQELAIIQQMEYYFGDYNLHYHKFLRNIIKHNEGWVDLGILMKFNRLQLLAADVSTILTALQKSRSKLLEINPFGKKVRRSPERPLPNDGSLEDEFLEKSVFVNGLPFDATLDSLLQFFNKFGSVEHLYLRRNLLSPNKPFKGSVYVMFKSKKEAEKFVAEENIFYKGKKLMYTFKADFIKRAKEKRAVTEQKFNISEQKTELENKFMVKNKKNKEIKKDADDDGMELEKACIHIGPFNGKDDKEKVYWIDFTKSESSVTVESEDDNTITIQIGKNIKNGHIDVVLKREEDEEYCTQLKLSREECMEKKAGETQNTKDGLSDNQVEGNCPNDVQEKSKKNRMSKIKKNVDGDKNIPVNQKMSDEKKKKCLQMKEDGFCVSITSRNTAEDESVTEAKENCFIS